MTQNNYVTVGNFLSLPCYIINLARNKTRWAVAYSRAVSAGFTDIIRFDAVDGWDASVRYATWRSSFPENFLAKSAAAFRGAPGVQGCYLSHMALWKEISDKEIPAAIVLEDDIFFHEDWHALWPIYWQQTPKNFDAVYMGSYVSFAPGPAVDVQPVFCNHAVVLTCRGATKLRDYTLSQPGRAIDCVSHFWQSSILRAGQQDVFNWYVWSARTKTRLVDATQANHIGLVFQDRLFPSDIRQRGT
jgi:hypothetical protein